MGCYEQNNTSIRSERYKDQFLSLCNIKQKHVTVGQNEETLPDYGVDELFVHAVESI